MNIVFYFFYFVHLCKEVTKTGVTCINPFNQFSQ